MATFRILRRAVTVCNPVVRHRQISVSAIVQAWNRDWAPAKLPSGQQEQEAAAKKYGLIPEDYKTFPDDGMRNGDYPQLPQVGDESRDPHYDWDQPHLMRNYNEPLHVNADAHFVIDPAHPIQENYMSYFKMFLQLVGLLGFLWILNSWNAIKIHHHMMPKQLPYGQLYLENGGDPRNPIPDTKHYTFEPVE